MLQKLIGVADFVMSLKTVYLLLALGAAILSCAYYLLKLQQECGSASILTCVRQALVKKTEPADRQGASGARTSNPLTVAEERLLRPTDIFKECSACPSMIIVPAGSFLMGSPDSEPQREAYVKGTEGPLIRVTISRAFAVGQFAVTRGEFAAFVAASGYNAEGGCLASQSEGSGWKLQLDRSWYSTSFFQDDFHPVTCVNWTDAQAYTTWLSLKTGKAYRLLSEAEREYVTRAGTTTPFWWGFSISTVQANYRGTHAYAGGSTGEFRRGTVRVDSFLANPWGLYNVHGNVSEWTEDCWNDTHAGHPGDARPRTSGDCSHRVLRGGSWAIDPASLRSAHRNRQDNQRSDIFGFRVARAISEK